MKPLLFLIFVTTVTVFGNYHPETPLNAGLRRQQKIVGGEEAEPHSIPYQVGLLLDGSFCGGSLITKRFVLTAAHCALVAKPKIVLGAHHIKEKEPEQVIIEGEKFIVHENYSGRTLLNDIALVELSAEAPLNEYIKTVELTSPKAGLYVGKVAQVSGWGRVYSQSPTISPVLRVVESDIITNLQCSLKFAFPIADTIICLDGSEKKSSCNGDSGGPLVVNSGNQTQQIGVVSFGSSAGCEKGFPSAYTRLTSYIDWIIKNSDYAEYHNQVEHDK
ncbi:hypothetical protein RUM44_010807 [Polyplax serrata]|uniref:Peptidase S1 domain-containing protein n=1 Tax=Polyplax serrata TaxID=468196 RepID=A0ABR1AN86_POLSC